jgi:hypothetical protein
MDPHTSDVTTGRTDVATARRVLEEIFPAADETALAEVISPAFVNHEAPPGTPPGPAGITMFMRMLAAAFSDQKWTMEKVLVDGDTVAMYCVHSGRHTLLRATGHRARVRLQADAHDPHARRARNRALGSTRRCRSHAPAHCLTRPDAVPDLGARQRDWFRGHLGESWTPVPLAEHRTGRGEPRRRAATISPKGGERVRPPGVY